MNPSKTKSHQESGCGISSCKGASDPIGLVSSRLQTPKGLNRSSSVTLETEKSRTPAPETDVCQWTIGNQAFEPRTGSRDCAAHCKGRAALEPCCKPHCRVHHINRKTMGMSAGVQVPRNLLLCIPPELSLSHSPNQTLTIAQKLLEYQLESPLPWEFTATQPPLSVPRRQPVPRRWTLPSIGLLPTPHKHLMGGHWLSKWKQERRERESLRPSFCIQTSQSKDHRS